MSKKEWGKGSKKDRLEENITVKKKLKYMKIIRGND